MIYIENNIQTLAKRAKLRSYKSLAQSTGLDEQLVFRLESQHPCNLSVLNFFNLSCQFLDCPIDSLLSKLITTKCTVSKNIFVRENHWNTLLSNLGNYFKDPAEVVENLLLNRHNSHLIYGALIIVCFKLKSKISELITYHGSDADQLFSVVSFEDWWEINPNHPNFFYCV